MPRTMGKNKNPLSKWFREKGKSMKKFFINRTGSPSKPDDVVYSNSADNFKSEETELDETTLTSLQQMEDPKEPFANLKPTAVVECKPSTSGMSKIVEKFKGKMKFSGYVDDDVSMSSGTTEESTISQDFKSRDSTEANHPSSGESNSVKTLSPSPRRGSSILERHEDTKYDQPWRYSAPYENMKHYERNFQMVEDVYVAVGDVESSFRLTPPPKPCRHFVSEINIATMCSPITSSIKENNPLKKTITDQTSTGFKNETIKIPQGKVHQLIKKFDGQKNLCGRYKQSTRAPYFKDETVLQRLEKKIQLLMKLLQTPAGKSLQNSEDEMRNTSKIENEKHFDASNLANLGIIESLKAYKERNTKNIPSSVLAELIEHIESLNEIRDRELKEHLERRTI